MRLEAAEVAGVSVETLPKTAVLAMVVKWLFSLLVEEKGGRISAAKIKQVCKVFDEQVPMEGIDDTLKVVDENSQGLTERQFYFWTGVCVMFQSLSVMFPAPANSLCCSVPRSFDVWGLHQGGVPERSQRLRGGSVTVQGARPQSDSKEKARESR